ncbi:S1C family serine protease [Derxia lacustris]|uniref:S1C family serine protease n=1 Tax=Derxia lacustris TaxID=764842 RepID=UPI001F443377|nr:trypsin-like peptidase domain-containing protein [Derxia lacustris]
MTGDDMQPRAADAHRQAARPGGGAAGFASARRAVLLALACSALGASAQLAGAGESQQPRPVTPRGPLLAQEQAMVALFESTAPSVAYITTETLQATGLFRAEVQQGAGSGFVWDAAGHVVTNNHVVEGARRVFVQLDAGQPIEATVVGASPEYDLAVVRLKRVPADLKPIPLGSSKELRIGQSVIAIGNPFGLSRTLTTGIVSALDRELPTTDFREVAGVIQTDAAINPGNSGGPLLDSAGRLVGVNSAIKSASGSSAGVGFAIPADLVNRVVPALIARGRAPLPGIGIAPVRPDIVARAGIAGVVIADIGRGTPAADAGLRAYDSRSGDLGDVIIGVNGRRVNTLSQFVSELDRAGIGQTAELTVVRGNRERTVNIRVIDLRR